MTEDKSQPWDAFLLAQGRRERYENLPTELRRALEGMVTAACDLYDETFTDPLSSVGDIAERVQAAHSAPGGRSIRKGHERQARYLRSTLPHRLEGISTEMRAWVAGVKPRSAPRFRGRSAS